MGDFLSSTSSSSSAAADNANNNDETSMDVAGAPQETFKRWVKEYRSLDKEIKAAGTALSAMRKRKKQLDEVILIWMQNNAVARVHLRDNDYLTRNLKTRLKPVNAHLITSVLAEYHSGDTETAEQLTTLIYDSREEEEKEILKVETEKPTAKRARTRAVDADGVAL